MDEQCEKYRSLGFDVYCPDLLNGRSFPYDEAENAYRSFYENAGLDACRGIWDLLEALKPRYEHIYIIGYSVGATMAWRCSENPDCSGVVACYGSRIRDYLHVLPKCPVLALFAETDRFDVRSVTEQLTNLPNTRVASFPAMHGFLDRHAGCYSETQAEAAEKMIRDFLDAPSRRETHR